MSSDRKSEIDREKIIGDYKNGLSLSQIHKKHGISVSNAYSILSIVGIMRSRLEVQPKWKKLCRIGKSNTRLVSIPVGFLRQAGFDVSNPLVGRWHADKGILILEIKRGLGRARKKTKRRKVKNKNEQEKR